MSKIKIVKDFIPISNETISEKTKEYLEKLLNN